MINKNILIKLHRHLRLESNVYAIKNIIFHNFWFLFYKIFYLSIYQNTDILYRTCEIPFNSHSTILISMTISNIFVCIFFYEATVGLIFEMSIEYNRNVSSVDSIIFGERYRSCIYISPKMVSNLFVEISFKDGIAIIIVAKSSV